MANKNGLFSIIRVASLVALAVTSTVSVANSGSRTTILTDELQKKQAFEQCTRMTPTFRTSYRDISQADIDKVDKLLPEALKKFAKDKDIYLDDYYRQYVGYEILRRNLIYVNGLHISAVTKWANEKADRKELLKNWKTQAITVCGGNEKFWGAIYDGQTNQITEVLFNLPPKKK